MKITIGVMGSASGELDPDTAHKVYLLGQEIAKHGCILLTGGCPGYPHQATKGAKSAGGVTVGISPALSLREHLQKYNSPTEDIDIMIYTGSGLMGREVTAIRSCEIIIIVGGRSGTLGEFAIAYDEGRLIGVLEGTGGIADEIRGLIEVIKKRKAKVIFAQEPKELIEGLLESYAHSPPIIDEHT